MKDHYKQLAFLVLTGIGCLMAFYMVGVGSTGGTMPDWWGWVMGPLVVVMLIGASWMDGKGY